jgi:hypothetical protein
MARKTIPIMQAVDVSNAPIGSIELDQSALYRIARISLNTGSAVMLWPTIEMIDGEPVIIGMLMGFQPSPERTK